MAKRLQHFNPNSEIFLFTIVPSPRFKSELETFNKYNAETGNWEVITIDQLAEWLRNDTITTISSNNDEIIKEIDSRPGGRALVQRYIVPAERVGVIHLAASRIHALRDEIGAVSTYVSEISEYRIL